MVSFTDALFILTRFVYWNEYWVRLLSNHSFIAKRDLNAFLKIIWSIHLSARYFQLSHFKGRIITHAPLTSVTGCFKDTKEHLRRLVGDVFACLIKTENKHSCHTV